MNRQVVVWSVCALSLGVATGSELVGWAQSQAASSPAGVREAAWSPDSRRLATTWFDAIWTMTPEGRDARRLVARADGWTIERDPAWAPDGKSVAFAAAGIDGFDLYVAPVSGGTARRVTTIAGDERWPSWTRDGRLVFAHRAPRSVWQLHVTSAATPGEPVRLTDGPFAEWEPAVSADGKRVAFLSDREPEGTEAGDIWVRDVPAPPDSTAGGPPASLTAVAPGTAPVRVTRGGGLERRPAWAPDHARVAFAATRAGQAGVWVAVVSGPAAPAAAGRGAGGGRPGGAGLAGVAGRGGRGAAEAATPGDGAVLASRKYGWPAWSPDGETLVIATQPTVAAGYNGDPARSDADAAAFLGAADDYALWHLAAPRAVDERGATTTMPAPDAARWTAGFDQVWLSLKDLYFREGASATRWQDLRAKYRPRMAQVTDLAGAEDVIDEMLAEQPLIKPAVESSRGVVASGHPLASQAGAAVLARGGNVIDAGIAVSFALGVVEPDASGVGGDGQAILYLKGMSEPVVIEYKDMTPSRATPDNPRLFTPTGARTAADGPTVANIPGVVAGMDMLYQRYGSKKVAWADLLAPAIALADEGFILDEALPTTIEEGRAQFAKYPETARVFLPGGRVPRAGDRFVNKDYAETLRTLAKEGGQSFYRGTIARRIAADMAENGGVISAEDLAQYRAVERKPLVGHYRGHRVYAPPPPVSTGLQLLETLQILDGYQAKPGATPATDPDYLHHLIEAWRVRDGGARIADPERYEVDLGSHLDPAHAAERFKLIDPLKVYTPQTSGRGGGLVAGLGAGTGGAGGGPGYEVSDADGPQAQRHIETGTTSFVVADAEGNMIAFTQTLSTWGGTSTCRRDSGSFITTTSAAAVAAAADSGPRCR